MPRGTGGGSIFKRGQLWWCRVYVDGVPVDESSKSDNYEAAKRHLTKMNGRKERGELGGANGKLTMDTILAGFLKALTVRVGEDTLKIQTLVVNAHLHPFFGKMRPEKIITDVLMSYREHRSAEKTNKGTFTSQSTINRELSLLRNAMRTAAMKTPPLIPLSCIPRFPITNEDECARQGFIDDPEFELLVAELPGYLVPITTVGYQTGIRLGELKKILWPQVDFDGRLIRLRSGRTKGGKPRTCPFIGNMYEVLLAAKRDRDEFWPECGHVFHRLGQPLIDFRGARDSAVQRAGLGNLEFHDLRRSGVRNLSRSGVPERVIMSITGHRTRAMFDRYNITSEADLDDAAKRMQAYRDAKKGLESGLNGDKNHDSARKEEWPRITLEPLSPS
jgi:integrase